MRWAERRWSALGLVLAAVAMSGDSVHACTCAGVPVCEAATGPAAVFLGVVTESAYPTTRFRVERMLLGEPATDLTLGPLAGSIAKTNPMVMTSCDLRFDLGERYLVYAFRHNETGDLVTSGCARTMRASDPRAAADLAYFDALEADRPTDGWLSGVVEERHYDSSLDADGRRREWIVRPLAGIPIKATSPEGESVATVTDENGVYVFTGLTPSAWHVMADLTAPLRPHDGTVAMRYVAPQPAAIWLRGATCAEAHVDARVDGSIGGQILDDLGRPGRGIVVELANVETLRTDRWARADDTVVADEQGRFEFRPLPAGRYVVGVDLATPERTETLDRRRYYAGVRALDLATVIELDRGAHVRLEPFQLPSLPAERTITLVLVATSPDVVAGTRVFLTGATKQRLDLPDGSIALRLPFGAAYEVSVEVPDGFLAEFRTSADPYRRGRERNILRDDTDRTIEIRVVAR